MTIAACLCLILSFVLRQLDITLSMCINFVAVTLSVLGLLTPTTGTLVHKLTDN